MAWAKQGSDTLSSTADTIDITFTEKTFLQTMTHQIESGSTLNPYIRFNDDSTTVYARRNSQNGAADGTTTSTNHGGYAGISGENPFAIGYHVDIASEEKLSIIFYMEGSGSGATNAPDRTELVSKYVPSPTARITTVNFYNAAGPADMAAGSNGTVLGTD